MPFSLSAKPPKPKAKKPKDRTVVRTGRGGAAVYKKKPVTPTPAPAQDTASIVPSSNSINSSAVASTSGPSTAPTSGGGAGGGTNLAHNGSTSQLSRMATSLKSSSNASATISDGGEAEDRIRAPAGREILSAKHRKIYSGRGGAGNAHKLLAEESVYERVLLHEQGIVQAYNDERKEFQGRSTGRGGSGNIKRKKKRPNGTSTTGSSSIYSGDGSSIRSASTKSWTSSSYRNRYRRALARANDGLNVNALVSLRLSGSGLGLTDDGDFIGLGLDGSGVATSSGVNAPNLGGTNTIRDSNVTTTTMTAISLSPIPSLQSLPTSDFAGSIVLGMMDRAVFERVTEEDEGEIAGAENLSQLSRPQLQGQTPVRVVVSPDTTTDNSREMLLQQGGFPMTSTPTTHLSTAYGKQASRGAGVATINHTNGSVHSSEAGASIVPSPSPVPSLLQQHPQLQHLHQQFSPSPVPSTLGNSPSPSSVGLRQAQSPSPSLIGSPALSSSTSVLSPVSHSPVLSSSSSSPLPTLPMLRNAHSNKPVMSSTNSITSRIKAGLSFVSGGNSGKKSGNGSGNGLNETISHSSIDSSSSFGTGVIPSSSFSHGGTGPTTTNGVVGKGKAPARSETPVLDIRHPSPSSLPYLDSYQDASGTDGIPSSIGTIRRANSANALNSFASSSSITSASMAAYAGPVSGQAYGAGSTPVPLARERALSAGNALNRSVAVYSSNAPTGPHPEDPLTLFSVYNQQQQHQQSPSVINSGASTPRSPSSLGHRSQQGYTSPDLGGSKRLGGVTPTNTERLLEPPIASTGLTGRLSPSPSPYAAAPTRNGEPGHSRQMSSSSTSGSDLDLSRYSFPDAPGHPPVMTGFNGKRKEHIEPLQVIVESMGSPSGSVEGLMVRRGSEPVMRSELHGHSHNLTSNMNNNSNYINNNALPPPPLASLPLPVLVSKSAGRAPIQPGAYQAGLRAVMDEATVIPDGTPPPYQPRASTRRYTDPSVPDSPPTEDMDPLTPTSYGYGTPTVAGSPTVVASPAYRVTSPHRPTMVVNNQQVSRLDTSPNTLRRPSAKGPVPSSPLSEVFIPDNGMGEGSSPVEQYYPTDPKAEKMQQMNGGGEKMHHGVGHQRTGSNRRPSDPYQRILAAAAVSKSNNPTPTPSRRGSSSQVQGLSPPLSGGFSSSGSADAFDENDVRSRPPSQAFSTYTRGTRFSTWGGSQATATAVDHHDNDFPNGLEEDDGVFYTSVLGDFDRYDQQEKNKSVKEHLMAKENNMLTSPPAHPLPSTPPLTPPSTRNTRSSSLGKDPSWQSRYSPSPPVPPMPKHLLAAVKQQQQIFAQQQQQLQQQQQATLGRSTPLGRQLPTPPVGPPPLPPMMHHPHFPGGMGWDELHRPVPRKLSKMEKALLRRVEFGAVGAADIAAIPLA